MIATTGNKGDRVRSDCFVTLEITNSGGLQIEMKSKVEAMFGYENRKLCREVMEFFGIENAILNVQDSGALPYVISARIEAAIKQLIDTDKEYLFEIDEVNKYESSKERFRFSRLYLPGNSPSMMINAGIHQPNGIILDMEDSVAFEKKGKNLNLSIEPFIRYWNIKKSENADITYYGTYIGYGWEPKNNSKEIGIMIALKF